MAAVRESLEKVPFIHSEAPAAWHSGYMPDPDVVPSQPNPNLANSDEQRDRQEWVRANFGQIFHVSAPDLQARGINPREYARQHREQIRQFARLQRSQGLTVPGGRRHGTRPGSEPSGDAATTPRSGATGGYGGVGRFGIGRRGGSAWIGILLALLALRFLLVDSLVGTHAAVFWVLGIGGIMLVARVFLFSWLRNRRRNRR
jgi:hypothetical protein